MFSFFELNFCLEFGHEVTYGVFRVIVLFICFKRVLVNVANLTNDSDKGIVIEISCDKILS